MSETVYRIEWTDLPRRSALRRWFARRARARALASRPDAPTRRITRPAVEESPAMSIRLEDLQP